MEEEEEEEEGGGVGGSGVSVGGGGGRRWCRSGEAEYGSDRRVGRVSARCR